MPRFSSFADMNVSVDDFLNECTFREIDEVIEWLKDNDYIQDHDNLLNDDDESKSALQELFEENLGKIKKSYLTISKEDFETINRIAKKY